MRKEEIQRELAKTFKLLRLKRHMSIAKMADAVYISEATWARYEDGKSSPTVPEFIRIFSELHEDALKYVLRIVYPTTYGKLAPGCDVKSLREAAAHYMLHVASDQTVRIFDYIIFGNHGSNIEPQMQEFCAYDHLPMDYKLSVACLIDNLYNLALERGDIIAPDQVLPDLEIFRNGLRKGKEAAYKRTNSYTTSTD